MKQLKFQQQFNLNYSLNCGQTFNWTNQDNCWYGVIKNDVYCLKQDDNVLYIDSTNSDCINTMKKYFRYQDNYELIISHISLDPFIQSTIQNFIGLRLIRQDPWECTLSYLCASNTSISNIRKMVGHLSKRFGNELTFHGRQFFTIPSYSTLSNASLSDIIKCKVGYRAKYIKRSAVFIDQNSHIFDELKIMNLINARKKLSNSYEMFGVGPKIADCILLFSHDMLDSFPIDTRILQTIKQYYRHLFDPEIYKIQTDKSTLTSNQYEYLSKIMIGYFGPYAGYAQEFLYCQFALSDKFTDKKHLYY